MPIQRKRVLREEEDGHEPGAPVKKLCPNDTTKKQTVEAAK